MKGGIGAENLQLLQYMGQPQHFWRNIMQHKKLQGKLEMSHQVRKNGPLLQNGWYKVNIDGVMFSKHKWAGINRNG